MNYKQRQDLEYQYEKKLIEYLKKGKRTEVGFLDTEVRRIKLKIKNLESVSDDELLTEFRVRFRAKIENSNASIQQNEEWLNSWVIRKRESIPSRIIYLKEVLTLYNIKLGKNPVKVVDKSIKNPNPNIFTDYYSYSCFKLYVEYFIVEPYVDFSYLFQRMKEEGYILRVKHRDFIYWLYKNNEITKQSFERFIEQGNFRSLKKAFSVQRENNFNNTFKSNNNK